LRSAGPSGARRIRIALVTGNKHKLEEIRDIARGSIVEFYQATARKLEIQSTSLEEIALAAARHAFEQLRAPLVVDDSGLFIEALNGFPGPYSSYAYRTIGVEGVLRLMRGISKRRACFVTAAALIMPPVEKVFRGRICGHISEEARGSAGFGFDPIFVPEGYDQTFAELGEEVKNSISHRSRAFRKLIDYLEAIYL